MKKLLSLSIMFFLFLSTKAQETPGIPPVRINVLMEEGVKKVNKFQLAVKKLKDCPLFDLSGTLSLFTKDAYVAVSSLNDNSIDRRKPDAYFRTVNALRCSFDPIYTSMNFDYLPVSTKNAHVSSFNGSYIISYDITQFFNGQNTKGKSYCDVTIKTVHVSFIRDTRGIWEGKIIGIDVDKTKKCEQNASKETALGR